MGSEEGREYRGEKPYGRPRHALVQKEAGGWRAWVALDAQINAEHLTWREVERGVCGGEGHGARRDGRSGEGLPVRPL